MLRLVFLCVLATTSVTWSQPHLPMLSMEMVNFINKANTTWKVRAKII